VLADKKNANQFIEELVHHHVSGILKIAPEHVSPKVLKQMRKPGISDLEEFTKRFHAADRKAANKNPQYLLPYFISAHPGATLDDAQELSNYLKAHGGFVPDQIQDFYPTPGTLATCMYYTGMDPFTLQPVYIPGKNPNIKDERLLQRAQLHSNKPENKKRAARAKSLLNPEKNHEKRKPVK
jgi:radical SAM superfamily enzyme YgiQ (UPF0313 family)